MISIESYRASIGSFYYKCKCLSNVDQNECFCKHYESLLMKHGMQPSVLNDVDISLCNNDSAEIKCKHCSNGLCETANNGDFEQKEQYGIPLCCNYMFFKYIDEHHEQIIEQMGVLRRQFCTIYAITN